MSEVKTEYLKRFKPLQIKDDEQVQINLVTYNGKEFVDIRKYWHPEDKDAGIYFATKSGVGISIEDSYTPVEELCEIFNELREYLFDRTVENGLNDR